MSLIEFNRDPPDRHLRLFAGVLLPMFAVCVAGLLWWKFDQAVAASIVLSVTMLFAVVGTLRPGLARPVYLGWMFASMPIGWVVGHVMLGVLFYGVFTPIGLVMRVFGRDVMARRRDETRESYWTERECSSDLSRYFRQF